MKWFQPLRNASSIVHWRSTQLLEQKKNYQEKIKRCEEAVQEMDTFSSFLCHVHRHDDEKVLMHEKTHQWKLNKYKTYKNDYLQRKISVFYYFVQFLIDNSFDLKSRRDTFVKHVDEIYEIICTLRSNVFHLEELLKWDQVTLQKSREHHIQGLISLAALCIHFAKSETLSKSTALRMSSHMKLLLNDLYTYSHYQPLLIDHVKIAIFESHVQKILFEKQQKK